MLPPYARSIHHDGSRRYVRNLSAPGSDPRPGDEILIRLRAAPSAPIERAFLRTCPDGEQHLAEMIKQGHGACQWWQATLRMSMPSVGYRMLLLTVDGVFWYNGSGLMEHEPTDLEDFRLLAGYAAPAWVREAVFYQIFPDRFFDADPTNNVRDDEFFYRGHPARVRAWGEPPARDGRSAMVEFYGGDLLGIEQKLEYLLDLGVNAIYLNPIFTAPSNHRYDVTDFRNVDPHLGGNAAFASLRRATRERDIRLIVDIVPNHVGVDHPWFQAALADPAAPSAEYFTFERHPEDYASWLGVKSLPKLNYRSAALRDAMYSGAESIFRYWLRPPYSIDGWRIDVANMLGRQGSQQLGDEVIRGIRDAVKAENPAAYLLGENFFDASGQLRGDALDGVMNYAGFATPLERWLTRFRLDQFGTPHVVETDAPISTQALADTWQAHRAAIPWQLARQQFNLIDSHDTPRIRSILGGNRAHEQIAAALLLTYLGAPSILYGDEVGMIGEDSLLARACMKWDRAEWDVELRAFYQALIRLRRSSPALIHGGFQILAAEQDTLAFLRDDDEEMIVVIANRGPGTRPAGALPVTDGGVPDGAELDEIISGHVARVADGGLALPSLPPGVRIYRHRAG